MVYEISREIKPCGDRHFFPACWSRLKLISFTKKTQKLSVTVGWIFCLFACIFLAEFWPVLAPTGSFSLSCRRVPSSLSTRSKRSLRTSGHDARGRYIVYVNQKSKWPRTYNWESRERISIWIRFVLLPTLLHHDPTSVIQPNWVDRHCESVRQTPSCDTCLNGKGGG